MTDQTLDDLAREYLDKIDPSGETPPDARASGATAYQLALMDLIYHQLEALTGQVEELNQSVLEILPIFTGDAKRLTDEQWEELKNKT